MSKAIHSDPEILGGTPVFVGTRVPVEGLFDHLAAGYTVEYFLEQFPSVRADQVQSVLSNAKQHAMADASA